MDSTVEFRKQFVALVHEDKRARREWKEFHKRSECARKRNCIKLMQLFCEKYGKNNKCFAELYMSRRFRALGTRSKCACISSHPSLHPPSSSSLFPIPATSQSYNNTQKKEQLQYNLDCNLTIITSTAPTLFPTM